MILDSEIHSKRDKEDKQALRDKIKILEDPIPAPDRALIREWINNTVQLRTKGTAINIKLASEKGRATVGKEISLIGNLVVPSHTEIQETFKIKTDDKGLASLELPAGSVVSLTWNVGILSSEHDDYQYQSINITPGEITELVIDK